MTHDTSKCNTPAHFFFIDDGMTEEEREQVMAKQKAHETTHLARQIVQGRRSTKMSLEEAETWLQQHDAAFLADNNAAKGQESR
jgi:hypothetical protein